MAAERARASKPLCPKGVHMVVLDERGSALRTQALAARLSAWQLCRAATWPW